MSRVTHKLLTPVVVGLSAGLLAQQASATEEMVVYVSQPISVSVRVDQSVFRAEIDDYIRSVSAELRSTLDRDLKRTLTPKLELASTATRARG